MAKSNQFYLNIFKKTFIKTYFMRIAKKKKKKKNVKIYGINIMVSYKILC